MVHALKSLKAGLAKFNRTNGDGLVTPIYRGFDQATLDKEYNARASVASFDDEYAKYVAASAEAIATVPRRADLVYDAASGATLDLYPGPAGAPVFLWIHGGYWRALSKDDNAFVALGLVPHGVSVAVMNYSLAPSVTLDEIVRQVRAAVRWLHRDAGTQGFDGRRIHVGGSSAGGHLAGMLLADDWQAPLGLPADIVASALVLSGLLDLEPLVLTHINAWMHLDAAAARRNSPQHLIPARSTSHLLAAVGGRETSEFKRQTDDYARAWAQAGHDGAVISMPTKNHFDLALSLMEPGGALAAAVVARIGARAA